MLSRLLPVFILSVASVQAHVGAWGHGMYCRNGTSGQDDQNTNDIVSPLWDLEQDQWWFHHVNNCDQFPPDEGDVLEIPSGGSFEIEIASARSFTTLSFGGKYVGDWTNGNAAPQYEGGGCIGTPQIHTQNESMAAGTAFAIAYVSELKDVTMDNLVVFSTAYNTPWKRLATYDVPPDMAPCPNGNCICAWVWAPNHCGEPNMYMGGFKCKVTGNTGNRVPKTPAQPPTWCENEPDKCTKGPKQMLAFNQASGNNIVLTGYQADGSQKAPGYNMKCGWPNGAQLDIFGDGNDSSPAPPPPAAQKPASTTSKKTTAFAPAPTHIVTTTHTSTHTVTTTRVQPTASTHTTSHTSHSVVLNASPPPPVGHPNSQTHPHPEPTFSPSHTHTTSASKSTTSPSKGPGGTCKNRKPKHHPTSHHERTSDHAAMVYHKRARDMKQRLSH